MVDDSRNSLNISIVWKKVKISLSFSHTFDHLDDKPLEQLAIVETRWLVQN